MTMAPRCRSILPEEDAACQVAVRRQAARERALPSDD